MARPTKIGLSYYPMDVGFLRDKKVRLLKAEFGAGSVVFVLYVLGKVYEEDGYFLKWDKDECLIAAAELGESPTYISEVLQGCLSRSLFDQGVFQVFGVLTSAGIQRRYLTGCEKRAEIAIAEEYWLLDIEDKNDVLPSIRAKLTFFRVSGEKNEVNSPETNVNSPGNQQSKEKKSKGKKSKEGMSAFSGGEADVPHPPKTDYDLYFSTYNSICTNLPQCKILTDKRKKAIRDFEKQMGKEQFSEICQKANASAFCTGTNDRSWKADFDFLIRADKAANILEGKYDGTQQPLKKTARPPSASDPNSQEYQSRMRRDIEFMDKILGDTDYGH